MNDTATLVDAWSEKFLGALADWGPKVVAALAILIIGYFVAKILAALFGRLMRKAGLDETLVRFIGNIAYVLMLAFVAIAAVGKLGVDTTSLAAIIAAAGLAIGLALQGSLGNFASGVMLIATRPFKVGDFVQVSGVSGTVDQINVFATTLNTSDNIKLIIPNGEITSGIISNYHGNDTRRLNMVMGIGYGDDMAKARDLFMKIVKDHPKVLDDPAPQVAVHELADSSVNLVVRPWVKTSDYWSVWFDLTEKMKNACDENGLNIPFPQRDVHLHQVA